MLSADKVRKAFLVLLRTSTAGEAIAARDALLRITQARVTARMSWQTR
jgi:hypothetical protein